ncbi:hypothetical protein D9611_005870 [Ephemerocybe angulata]|uniref:Uncharacterized protein n=1 Tax=Ephemerocybe angulata TaxID=980116 RepID=A0A8H5CIA9_9AGAR|nr:hypothetical protein D9611_005870 [Tulosesus angulatus]
MRVGFAIVCVLALKGGWVLAQDDTVERAEHGTVPYQFGFAALNASSSNANNTGATMVLGAGGATGGVTVYSTSTWNSFPYGNLNTFALVNNALRGFYEDGTWAINATSVNPGDALTWIASRMYSAPQEKNAVYSIISSIRHEGGGSEVENSDSPGGGGRYPILAAYGKTDLWSLCPDKSSSRPQTRLVYDVPSISDPPPSWLTFDPKSCYGVVVNVVPVSHGGNGAGA